MAKKLGFVNSDVETFVLIKYNEINDKIANLTKSLVELESEKQTILQEYKTAANQNLKFILGIYFNFKLLPSLYLI